MTEPGEHRPRDRGGLALGIVVGLLGAPVVGYLVGATGLLGGLGLVFAAALIVGAFVAIARGDAFWRGVGIGALIAVVLVAGLIGAILWTCAQSGH